MYSMIARTKDYKDILKLCLQNIVYANDRDVVASNYVAATLATALLTVGLFHKMPFKKHSNYSHHDPKGLNRTLDEIQTRLNISLEKDWGNITDKPYIVSNNTMRP